MPRYKVSFSGSAMPVEADSPEHAWKLIRESVWCYCGFDIKEIGKEVDEQGWPIKQQVVK